MVSSRFFTTFVLMSFFFFFFFQLVWNSCAQTAIHEILVPKKYRISSSASTISSDVKKEVHGAGVSSTVEARETRFRSRKMELTRKALGGDDHVQKLEESTSGTTNEDLHGKASKVVSGANSSVGNSLANRRQKKMAVVLEDDDHRVLPHNLKIRSHGAKMTSDFVAFSADYHMPKPHPPRHN